MVVEIYHMRSVPYQPETFENCEALNSGASRRLIYSILGHKAKAAAPND